MTTMPPNDTRCSLCSASFNLAAMNAQGLTRCPNCGVQYPPVKIKEDGYIPMNWQDVRVLAIYAQRWAATFDTKNYPANLVAVKVLERIVAGLYRYMPKDAETLDPSLDHPDVANDIARKKENKTPDGMIESPFFELHRKQ